MTAALGLFNILQLPEPPITGFAPPSQQGMFCAFVARRYSFNLFRNNMIMIIILMTPCCDVPGIIIYGASTSVGTFVTQLAKRAGLRVIGITGDSVDYAKSFGADVIINYKNESDLVRVILFSFYCYYYFGSNCENE